jgi:2-keto-3-deoxy-L-rhamnonate aldolase RhmA
MQANPLRASVDRGELQIGTWVNLVRNPAILTLLKAAGLDFARVDMEHSTPSHAAEIVAASRYAPRGRRGNAGHSPGTDYDMTGSAAERRAFANQQVFVMVMFETATAFADLDEIAG